MELSKFVVPEFIIGEGAIDLSGRYAANFQAKNALIVTDPGVISSGWLAPIQNSLSRYNISNTIFSNVTPNPKDYEVAEGAEVFRKEKCDIIIALGGGSPVDCAKAIGIVCSNKKDIHKFEGVDRVKIPMPPLICIPTTAGTAADISQFAIITNTQKKVKMAIISKAVVPDVSLIDPATTTTMDYALTAATGMDALVHAIEAYVSNASSEITDLHALEAIKLISNNLQNASNNLSNIEYRNNMMLASHYAGMAFSNASLGIVHAMAHSLGGFRNLPHGECNALLLEHCIDFNYSSAREKYNEILRVFTGGAIHTTKDKKADLISYIADLRKSLNIEQSLSEMGIKKADLSHLAKNAHNDACLATNPKEASIAEIKVLYEQIF